MSTIRLDNLAELNGGFVDLPFQPMNIPPDCFELSMVVRCQSICALRFKLSNSLLNGSLVDPDNIVVRMLDA